MSLRTRRFWRDGNKGSDGNPLTGGIYCRLGDTDSVTLGEVGCLLGRGEYNFRGGTPSSTSIVTGSIPRCPLWYHSLVHSQKKSYFVGIGPICDVELTYIFRPVFSKYWIYIFVLFLKLTFLQQTKKLVIFNICQLTTSTATKFIS